MMRGRLLLELGDGAVRGGWLDRSGRFWPIEDADRGGHDLGGEFWFQPRVGKGRRQQDRPRLLREPDPLPRGGGALPLPSPLPRLREVELSGLPEDRELGSRAAGRLLEVQFEAVRKWLGERDAEAGSLVAIVPPGTSRLGQVLVRCAARRHGWSDVQIVPRPLAAALSWLEDLVAEGGVVIEATSEALEFHWVEGGGTSHREFRQGRSEREEGVPLDSDLLFGSPRLREVGSSETPWVCLGEAGEPWVRAVTQAVGRPPAGRGRSEWAALDGLLAGFRWLALDRERRLDLETEGALFLADGSGGIFELLPARAIPRRPGERATKRQVVRAVGEPAEPAALGFLWGPSGAKSGLVPVGVVPAVVATVDDRVVALHFRLERSPRGQLRGTVTVGDGPAHRLSFPQTRTRLFDPWSPKEMTP